MTTIKRFIYVDAPPETVEAVGLDTELLPTWFEGVDRAAPDDRYPLEGGTMQVRMRSGAFSMEVTQTIVEREPGQRTLMTVKGQMVDATIEWFYKDEGDRTRVSVHYHYDMPDLGGVGRMLEGMIDRASVENMEKSLINLKRLVESKASLRRSA